MLSRALLISIVLITTTINSPALAQDAGSAYRERYQIVGELARATAVCSSNNDEAKWFLSGLTQLKAQSFKKPFSKSFKETTASWMRSGGESFNRKVMSDGIPAACAFARSERARALQLANEPITPAATKNDEEYVNDKAYDVVFSGSCNFKMLNRDQFGNCDPQVTFTDYKVHRSSFEFSGSDGKALFVFEGGHERQPDLENYFLIDKIKIGTVTDGRVDGIQGTVEGECHMRQNADASQFYDVKCDVFDRKTRMVYNFYLTSITHFDKHPY